MSRFQKMLLVLAGLAASSAPARADVTVCSDANMAGKCQTFAVGRYDVSALSTVGNDSISSISVPMGQVVTVYADAGFAGSSVKMDGFTSTYIFMSKDLSLKSGWNDRISSLVVENGSSSTTTAWVCTDAGYGGKCVELAVGNYDVAQLNNLGIGNDSISSLIAGSKVTLKTFMDAGYAGGSKIWTAGTSIDDLNGFQCTGCARWGWNDCISSLQVLAN